MLDMVSRIDEEVINLKIRIVSHRLDIAILRYKAKPSRARRFLVNGWLRAQKKFLYALICE